MNTRFRQECLFQSCRRHIRRLKVTILLCILSNLTHSRLGSAGPAAKLGCPHPLNPMYLQYFARFASSGQLEDSESALRPDMLFVSAFSSLLIRVDGISAGASVSCSPAPLKNDPQPDIQRPLESVAESSPNQLHLRHSTALSSAVIWLTQRASSRENYQLFINSQHHVLQNSDVILVWRFASEFYDIYHRAKSNTVRSLVLIIILLMAHDSFLGNSHN